MDPQRTTDREGDPDRHGRTIVFAEVILLEAAIIVVLWLLGRMFS